MMHSIAPSSPLLLTWKRQNPPKSPGFDWEMYRYTPSLVGAIICIVVFAAMAALHVLRFFRSKNRIIIFLVIGALSWGPFITQGVLLLVGPLWFAATVYMMLGRTIRLAGAEDVASVGARWYTRVFVTADVTTLIVQGLGASIMGTMQLSLAIAGEKIVIAGLAMQVATFVVFLIAAGDFHMRMRRRVAIASTPVTNTPWERMLYILYSVSALILLRCVFRLIEYSMGNAAYLIAHEWTLYCFDAVPMFLVLVSLLVFEPSWYVTQDGAEKVEYGYTRKKDRIQNGNRRL
ncbi:RTA1 like protein-domain-containing protein [Bipolaris maydis]|nr:RTA1 like protein-domain-containing protein [Bipolaris maydis]